MQDPPKTASPEWCSEAREMAQILQEQQLRKKVKFDTLLQDVEGEIAQVESIVEENQNEQL
jgi:hypothetical protein